MKERSRLFIIALLALTLVLSAGLLSSCSSSSGNASTAKDTLSGTTATLLPKLNENGNALLPAGVVPYMTFEAPVTDANCKDALGLTAAQLGQYVDEATVSQAAIGTHAHIIVLAKCKSFADASTVAGLVADGFDSGRLICAFPDRSFVQVSGSYVLLVSSSAEHAKAFEKAFSELADGNVGAENTFYTLK